MIPIANPLKLLLLDKPARPGAEGTIIFNEKARMKKKYIFFNQELGEHTEKLHAKQIRTVFNVSSFIKNDCNLNLYGDKMANSNREVLNSY